MNILIFSPNFYPSIGGLEILVQSLAFEFSNKGHKVVVISNSGDIGNIYFPFKVIHNSNSRILFIEYLKCDVYFMPNLSLKGAWPFLIFPFKRWVISHNNCYMSGINQQTWHDYLKLSLMYLAKNISVSKDISKQIWAKSTVIYNCYRNDIFHNKYGLYRSPNILFVGRLVSDKGIIDLLKACNALWDKNIQFKLTIAGDGPMKPWITEFINKYGLENRVFLKGFVSNERLAMLMNENFILVVPSYKEAFGIVVLEGLACGCKVIVSDSGALHEALGNFGDTFITGDIDSLANKINLTLNEFKGNLDVPLNQELQMYLRSFSPSKISEQYLSNF